MATTTTTATTPTDQAVILIKPHTHRGQALQPGDQIRVAPAIAEWLHAQGVIEASAPVTAPAPATATKPRKPSSSEQETSA